MKGIIRNVDGRKRVLIPASVLRAANIETGDAVGVYLEKDVEGNPVIVLSKYESGCFLCGNPLNDQASKINDHYVCVNCVNQLKAGNP